MKNEPIIHGPEDLIPGRFYHHAGMRGIVYVCAGSYWTDPGTGNREPQPGTEVMVSLNGCLPGAFVYTPEDGSSPDFWAGFYPAPGLQAIENILEGVANVIGQLKVLERETGEGEIAALANTAIGSLQILGRNIEQIGHRDYAEDRPIEIQAKDRTIGLYVSHINVLLQGIELIGSEAHGLAKSVPAGTRTFQVAAQIANQANRLAHLSPLHPQE